MPNASELSFASVRAKWIRKCPHCAQMQHLDIVPALGFQCWNCGEATTYQPIGLIPLPELRPFYNRFWRRSWCNIALILMIPIFALTYWSNGPLRNMTNTMLGEPYYGPIPEEQWCDFACEGTDDAF